MNIENPSPLFYQAVDLVIQFEGGYVNDPADNGGETKYGISKRSYPSVDIEKLTEQDAKAIYFEDYWKSIQGDYLPNIVAIALFDAVVNHGVKAGVKLLQKCLGVKVDGVIGPQTIRACYRQSARTLLVAFLTRRAERYQEIIEHQPSQTKFFSGWMRRLFKLHHELRIVI